MLSSTRISFIRTNPYTNRRFWILRICQKKNDMTKLLIICVLSGLKLNILCKINQFFLVSCFNNSEKEINNIKLRCSYKRPICFMVKYSKRLYSLSLNRTLEVEKHLFYTRKYIFELLVYSANNLILQYFILYFKLLLNK